MFQFTSKKHLLRNYYVHSIWDTKTYKTFFKILGMLSELRVEEMWILEVTGRVSGEPETK